MGPYGLGGYGDYAEAGGAMPPTATDSRQTTAAPESAAPGAPADGASSGTSSTNVQEEGVDEPDIVKTDGRHLYSVAGSELRIVSIADGTPRLAAKRTLDSNGNHELLLSGNRLLVITRSFAFATGGGGGAEARPAAASIAPPQGRAKTRLTSMDVTDPSQPIAASVLEIEGDYRSARMIGSVARVVIQSDPGVMPFVFPSGPDRESERAAAEHNRTVVESSTLDDWLPGYTVRGPDGAVAKEGALLDCGAVRSPPIFSGLGTLSVVSIDVAGSVEPTSSAGIVASGQTVYASTSRLFVSTGRWGWEPDALDNGPATEVHGFDISNPAATTYTGSGVVPGYILNPLSSA